MKKIMLGCLLIAFLIPAVRSAAQKKVYVSDKVLKTASWARFKYKDELKNALNQDPAAVRRLLEFSGTVDGQEGLDHAVTCLEMIPAATDDVVAVVVAGMKPNAKKLLLERLSGAVSRTQKKELQKPIAEWAPNTWAALNNKPVTVAPKQETLTIDRSGARRQETDQENAGTPAPSRN